ncbi:NADPH-dependent FMN reductase [Aurantiacibacter gilvus]|uniref:NAD(P)H-dependent oxidoreductase n=1 Tax=Aurantiacibacter gilvus TaxID=3139141 RepID=A0ABU9IFK3_9SPHN
MSRKILAFAASNSSVSINRQLVEYAASLLEDAEIETLDIHEFEMPLYRHDREEESGIPQLAHDFRDRLASADALLIGLAEHNGHYPAAFKNLFDWCTRIDRDVWQGKPMVLLATSGGPGGAGRVLDIAATAAPVFGGDLRGTWSLPQFYDAFDMEAGELHNPEHVTALKDVLAKL